MGNQNHHCAGSIISYIFLVVLFFMLVGNRSNDHYPALETLRVAEGTIMSVAQKNCGRGCRYELICLSDSCAAYSQVLPRYPKVLREGELVRIWIDGGAPPNIWQISHHDKVILNYGMARWSKESNVKVLRFMWDTVSVICGLVMLVTTPRTLRCIISAVRRPPAER